MVTSNSIEDNDKKEKDSPAPMDKNPAVLMSKTERELIMQLFARQPRLSFTAIEEATGLRSNHLVYFLNQLQDEDMIVKFGSTYKLTLKGQNMIPHLSHLSGKESPPLAVVTAAIVKGKQICLLKRKRMPFQGYWGLIGGKLRHNETIIDAAIREVKEETGLDVIFDQYCGLCHEHVREIGTVKHSFLLFLCKMSVVGGDLVAGEEGDIGWFDIKALAKEKVIPSDLWMINNMLKKKVPYYMSHMEDKETEYVFEAKTY